MHRRRTFLTALGGALLIGGPARKAMAGEQGRPNIFETFHRSLVQVHGELREGVRHILDAVANTAKDASGTDALIASFSENLLNHHKAEDRFFFPAFRAAGRLRSSDVAFLDARDTRASRRSAPLSGAPRGQREPSTRGCGGSGVARHRPPRV